MEQLPPDPLARVPAQPAALPALTTHKSLALRGAAFVIDTLIWYALIFAATFALGFMAQPGAALFGMDVTVQGNTAAPGLDRTLLSLILWMIYYAVFELLFGATPGKALLGMRVVMEDGWPVTAGAVLIRGIARLIPDGLFVFIPGVLAISQSPVKQRNGDKWAHTVVVDRRDPGLRGRRGVGRLALAAVLTLVVSLPFMWLIAGFQVQSKPAPIAADAANLTAAEVAQVVGPAVGLADEQDAAALAITGVDDANLRVFASNEIGVVAFVAIFSARLSDDEAALRKGLSEYIDLEAAGATTTKQTATVISLGELGMVQDFSVGDTVTHGTAVMYRTANRLVRVLVYDQTGAATTDRTVQLAQAIETRVAAR